MTRFDLEQQILDCWNVTKDIDLIFKNSCDGKLTDDNLQNVLLGLSALYEMKFEQMWETFEKCVSNKVL